MAIKPLHAYTVAEASNLKVYESYKCEILTLSGTGEQTTATWNTPAKEVIIYSAGSAANDDGITISLKTKGSHGNDIVLSHDNLPFTVKGVLVEEVVIHGDGAGDNDALTVLSFH
jgi:glycerate kinase